MKKLRQLYVKIQNNPKKAILADATCWTLLAIGLAFLHKPTAAAIAVVGITVVGVETIILRKLQEK